ncbi:MAG TPA: DUF2161 family putative PD-(D/E)XK-type phosphodiesterase [Anaerolineae bacterium]|nr:DUF2161 family putative PD-(D/E)XK-type phosphodiesterase [Anaerolineae bacterium]HPL28550.1 DUF2161 family putative PD-(D/E)XK-type phosphodiesterase [Anaerolineae bacterium]
MTASTRAHLRETDLYGPVRDWLAARGYTVRSEVKDCDIAATRGDELVVVELKRGFSVDLLLQATQRQRVADSVYVALPKPDVWAERTRWRHIEHLLRRLELGLILVSFATPVPVVDVAFDPQPLQSRRNTRGRRAILREMAGRSGDHNHGGSTRRSILTAYREQAIYIACCLEKHGPLSPERLRELGAGEKTQAILRRNVYGWFERVQVGVYALGAEGREALAGYADLAAQFRAALDGTVGRLAE